MKHTVSGWQVAGFLFTSILGTFLHFLFDLSGQNIISSLFSAVNESIWEHLKLIYFPMVLFACLEFRILGKSLPHFWCVKLAGILMGLTLIPVSYYTYSGIWGKSVDLINITIFFLAAGAVYWAETLLLKKDIPCKLSSSLAAGLILLIGVFFILWTFFPPEISFFRDPQTGTYGFQ